MIVEKGSTPTMVFLLVDDDDGLTPVEGLAADIKVQLSKAGGSFADVSGSIAEIGTGWYKFTLSETETDVEGPLIVEASAAGTLEWRDLHQVYASFEANLAAGLMDRIADHVLRRNFANTAASSHGDSKTFRSLLGAVAKDVNRVELAGATLSIYEANDTDILGTQTVVTNHNATPITGIDTNGTNGTNGA